MDITLMDFYVDGYTPGLTTTLTAIHGYSIYRQEVLNKCYENIYVTLRNHRWTCTQAPRKLTFLRAQNNNDCFRFEY